MILKCKFCGKEWNYKGNSFFYCTCPDCLNKVSIKSREDKKELAQ